MSSTKKPQSASKEAAGDGADSYSESDDERIQIFNEEVELEVTDNLYPLIQKVKTVVPQITIKKRNSTET
jgi:hypothetical protein